MPSTPFVHAYDFEKLFHLERLRVTIEKAEVAFETLEPEAIDYCKCIIETMCKHVLEEKGESYIDNKGKDFDLPTLIKKTLAAAGFKNDQIRGGISSLVSGIAELRNSTGIAGHGGHGAAPLPTDNDIRMFVSVFQNLITILWHSFAPENIDIRRTNLKFKALEEKLKLGWLNQEADENISVEYSQEDGLIYVEGKEIRPSEVLYRFDPENYVKKIERIRSDSRDRMADELTYLISDQFNEGVFDSFEPHAYGWEHPEVWIYELENEGKTLKASGTVSTSVRLGASSDEDGFDVDYSSAFTAIFSVGSDDDSGERIFELEDLSIEQTDWIDHSPEDDEPDLNLEADSSQSPND